MDADALVLGSGPLLRGSRIPGYGCFWRRGLTRASIGRGAGLVSDLEGERVQEGKP